MDQELAPAQWAPAERVVTVAQRASASSVRTETFVPDRWKPTTPGNLLVLTVPFPIRQPFGWTPIDDSGQHWYRFADGSEDGSVTYRRSEVTEITEFG